jgi:hypothetical protein
MFDTGFQRLLGWIGLQWFPDKDRQNFIKINALHKIYRARYIVQLKIVDVPLTLTFSAAV